ncbi:hypothetical protein [Streptomyces sp. NPDC048106]|uniref:hypothetical protein n=1 Tax=Streptomyces sp. NPDC048106 TaxID=3155750 RepID=UPI00345160E4
MSDLDFYAHAVTRGDVLGAGIGSAPGVWEARAGTDYLDVPGRGLLRRDYGLVEVSFSGAGEEGLTCDGIGVQVHRLIHGPCAPAPLVRAYGEFRPRVRFAELRSAIAALGCAAEPEDVSKDVHRYRVSGSGARIFVIEDPDPYGDGSHDTGDPSVHQTGDVWALSVSPGWWGRAAG